MRPCQFPGCPREAGAAGRHCDEHYQHPGPLPASYSWGPNASREWAESIDKRLLARESLDTVK